MNTPESDIMASDELETLLLSDEYNEEDWFSSITVPDDVFSSSDEAQETEENRQTAQVDNKVTVDEDIDRFFSLENNMEESFEVDYDYNISEMKKVQSSIQKSHKKTVLSNPFYSSERKETKKQEFMTICTPIKKHKKDQPYKKEQLHKEEQPYKEDHPHKEDHRPEKINNMIDVFSQKNDKLSVSDIKRVEKKKGTFMCMESVTTLCNQREMMAMERKNTPKKESL